jgi:outer membrane lipoprotein-sorting protein
MSSFKNNNDEKWLDDLLERIIGSEKTEPDFKKWQQSHLQAVETLLARAKRQSSTSIHPLSVWRIIMKSRITRLAAAAVIVIAVLAGIYFITGKPPAVTYCAWAQIADKVAQIKTCVYRTHTKMYSKPGVETEIESKTYISSVYGYRTDAFTDGKITQQTYMSSDNNAIVLVMPSQKKYMRLVLTDEQLAATKSMDPRALVTNIALVSSDEHKDLGKDIINGVEVRGIEVNNPPATRGVYNNFIGRMWVDAAAEYPVRIEIEVDYGTGAKNANMVTIMDGFEWGTELDAAIFEPNIPPDYTMMAEMKMTAPNEASAIEGFKCFSELTKGKYPASIETMMQEGMDFFTQSMQQSIQESLVKDMNIVPGARPSEAMQQEIYNKAKKMSEAMQPEITRLYIKLQGPFQFYNKLTQEDKDPVYYGKDVPPGDANAVLMRWKVSDNEYRVIFGDLGVETITADELAELEADLTE